MQRSEGVVLVLLGDAISGWRLWGARMVWHDLLHVVRCYVPTQGLSKAVKDEI